MNKISEFSKCIGCGACEQACPTKCISMTEDREGFLRPVIDLQKCVDCNKCKNICPVVNLYFDDGKVPVVIGAKNKSQEVRMDSSSGGVFTALAEKIIDLGGVVFGVGFDEDFNAVHKFTETKEGIKEFRKSKYVQSKIGDTYLKAKEFLKSGEGRTVLFTGTPCQISGLYAFLGEDYENLYTADFICHGVPSPKVWSGYVKFRENQSNSKTKNISFRSKENGWKLNSMSFEFENGQKYTKVVTEEMFLKGFLADLYLRPSCYDCDFKNMHRQADITIADFWSIDKVNPEFNDDKGTSLVLLQSQKGEKLWESVSGGFDFFVVDDEKTVRENYSYLNSVKMTCLRKDFFRKYGKKSFDKLIDSYCGSSYLAKLRRFLSKLKK